MRDYAELSKSVHCCVGCEESQCEICPRGDTPFSYIECKRKLADDAADAIEELLAASPPALWTDKPIEGTGFMTHTQGGGKGFEIHFRTDSLEKYKAVQEECRRQIDHAKTDPPKEDAE